MPFYGKLANNWETTAPFLALSKACSTSEYDAAVLLWIRVGHTSAEKEASDGTLPIPMALGCYRGSRRVAKRLAKKLVEVGLWQTDGTTITDVAWTSRFRTHAQILDRRRQQREHIAGRRADARDDAGDRVPPPDDGWQPSDDPCPEPREVSSCDRPVHGGGGYPPARNDTVRTASNEQFQPVSGICRQSTVCTDTDLQAPLSSSAPTATLPAMAPRPKHENLENPVFLSGSSSVLGPRQSVRQEDLPGWLAEKRLAVQMTGTAAAMAAKLCPMTATELDTGYQLALEWGQRDGGRLCAGRILRCVEQQRVAYEAEMARPMPVPGGCRSDRPRGTREPDRGKLANIAVRSLANMRNASATLAAIYDVKR